MRSTLVAPVLAVVSIVGCYPRLSRDPVPRNLTLTQAAWNVVWQGYRPQGVPQVFVGVEAADLPPGAQAVTDSDLASRWALFVEPNGLRFTADSLGAVLRFSYGPRVASCRVGYTVELRRRSGCNWTVRRAESSACA